MAIADRRQGGQNGFRQQSESASYNGYNVLASSEPKAASMADCVLSQRLRLQNKSPNSNMSQQSFSFKALRVRGIRPLLEGPKTTPY